MEDDLLCQDNLTSTTVYALQTEVQIVENMNDCQCWRTGTVFDEMEILEDSNLPDRVLVMLVSTVNNVMVKLC